MKVYIGPYISRWSSRSFERWLIEKNHKKPYWEVDDDEMTVFDKATVKFCDIWQIVLDSTINKYFDIKERKINVRIDWYDTWSADHTLALIIHPLLLEIQKNKNSSPNVEHEDVPEHLRPHPDRVKMHENGEIEEWEIDNTIHERWEWVLGEMIHAFECAKDDAWEMQFHTGVYEPVWVEKGDLSSLEYGPSHTHKFDVEGYRKAFDRQKNGLRLFGKYYHALWD